MSDEQYPAMPPPPPPVPSSQRFPTWKQALMMFLGGCALTSSACFGCTFVVDLAPRDDSALAFFGTFLMVLVPVGLLVTLFGGLLVLTRILHALFGKKDDSGSGGGRAEETTATSAYPLDNGDGDGGDD